MNDIICKRTVSFPGGSRRVTLEASDTEFLVRAVTCDDDGTVAGTETCVACYRLGAAREVFMEWCKKMPNCC